jgi:hypothetical protein
MTELGPTGDFPEGKLGPDDEGGLVVAINVTEGKVRVDFGTPVAWFALSHEQALEYAAGIIDAAMSLKFAAELAGRRGETIQ